MIHSIHDSANVGPKKEADDDLVAQIVRSRDLFEAFQVPMYDKSGFEADDILGTIVEKVKDKKDIELKE